MKLINTTPCKTDDIATPKDYTSDYYKFYFELMDYKNIAYEILLLFTNDKIIKLSYGYEVILNIQMIPDIVKEIASKNIAIYQIIRYAKIKS